MRKGEMFFVMNWFHKLRLRFRALFQKEKLDARMDDEMRSHIEMQTQENIEAGLKPDEARYAALRQFGWVESVVMKANTKSPGDSAAARTTHGRRIVPDKSVNGNAARTISPTCGMSSAEIGVFVPRLDVGVGIKVRLRREKVEGSTLLRDPGHHFAGNAIIPRLRYHEHELRRGARPGFRRDAHDAGSVHLDLQCFHAPNLTHGRTPPSFFVPLSWGACRSHSAEIRMRKGHYHP